MSAVNTGGPAFPRAAGDYNGTKLGNGSQSGMTLRDYFAAEAMPAVYVSAMREAEQGSGLFQDDQWRLGLALDAYAMADAMLKARDAS
jgi:hypothetical protein